MAFCSKCGEKVEEGTSFCPKCGAPMNANVAAPVQATPVNDAQENKFMAILSYIIFFIPLIAGTHKTSSFVRFHVNQGTILAIASIVLAIAVKIVNSVVVGISWRLWLSIGFIFTIVNLIPMIFAIIGIVNAAQGNEKELPIIGKYEIIK